MTPSEGIGIRWVTKEWKQEREEYLRLLEEEDEDEDEDEE